MDEIREVINKVVRGCGKCGVEIDDVLAAFVARTIVESNESMFALDRKMTAANTEEIILQAIEKLIERDNPSLETMKMQVDYDTSFIKHDAESQKALRVRNKMIANHKMTIVEVIMEDANDFEALTVLYRKIFRFLLDFAPNSKGQDRQVEREVAAALESVFPRIGLKAFVLLSYEEKSSQLSELARIVLGIRLFNRDQNRGGAGIDQMDKEGSQLAMTMLDDVNNEVAYFSDACNKYQLAIIRAQLIRRKSEIEKESKAEAKGSSSSRGKTVESNVHGLVPEKLVDRWLKEMVNRRQYLGFLRTLQDEMMSLQDKVSQICLTFREELVNVQQMVTNKASVSKELVYPKFDALGALWVALYEEVTILLARSNTFGVLCKYRLSFTPTLDEKYYSGLIGIDGYGEAESVGLSLADLDWTADKDKDKGQQSPNKKGAESKDGGGVGGSTGGGSGMVVAVDGVEIQETTEAGATLMSVHNTPDFLLLPLELQGYCPWTIVHAHGLLLPGKPALGVVRYDNIYYVCQHVQAMKSFMEDPEYYLKQIRLKALTNPEYIHLLRLQRWFPTASIARLLDQDDHDPSSLTGKPTTRDASTGTPVHFIDTFIDINYHWNEWELRRKALKIVNLTNCTTISQQTDLSHFRRNNDAQVYGLREKTTQTKRDKGTNPPIVTSYIAGLRGKPNPNVVEISKYVAAKDNRNNISNANNDRYQEMKESRDKSVAENNRSRVITLKLDL